MPVDCKRVDCGGVASSEEGRSHRQWGGGKGVGAPTKAVAPHRGFVRTQKWILAKKKWTFIYAVLRVCTCLCVCVTVAVSLCVANANVQSHLWLLVLWASYAYACVQVLKCADKNYKRKVKNTKGKMIFVQRIDRYTKNSSFYVIWNCS